jgi:hypothetical protein
MLFLLTQIVFFGENLVEQAYMQQNEPFFILKTMTCRNYSFQNLTQFSQENNVLDAAASNIDGFLSRDTCVSLTQKNRLIWRKDRFSPPENCDCRKYSFPKLTQFSQGENALDSPASNIDGILYRDKCVSSTYLNRSIWSKQSLSPP